MNTPLNIPSAPKSIPHFANFSNNHRDLLQNIYTLTQLISREYGKLYCIMYRADKTVLLLILATSRFDVIKDKTQKLKVNNDVQGRLYGCHTTKTAKNKKEGDNTLQYIARMSM